MNDMRKLMEAIESLREDAAMPLTKSMADQLVAIPFPEGLELEAFYDFDEQETGGVDQIVLELPEGVFIVTSKEHAPHVGKNLQDAAKYFGESLDEVAVRRDDEAMLDYEDEGKPETSVAGDAPYYVAWYAQSWEWYGDDDPAKGQGRYKPKGDGGRIVAINVPTYDQAQKIADKLEQDYNEGKFEDKNVYSKHGEDYYILDWHGVDIRPMSKMDEFEKEELNYVHPNFKPVDYSGKK